MGIRSGNFVFLRPAQHGGKDRTGRPGSREKEIEFEREIPQAKNPSGLSDRGALSQERLRKRSIFGSVSRIVSIDFDRSMVACLLLVLQDVFRSHGHLAKTSVAWGLGVENDDFEAILLEGIGAEFSGFLRPSYQGVKCWVFRKARGRKR